MELASRVALVTGGGRRVGQALALALARQGMHLAIHYNSSAEGARTTQVQAQALGVQAELFQADLEDPSSAKALPAEVARRFGRLDVLVNSAGIMPQATVEETTPELWDQTMAVNLKSHFFTVQGALPYLRQAKGKIVNLADVGGLEPWPRYTAHCVSKAGVVMLTKTLALALAPDITVNAIAPGAVLPPDEWSDAAREHLARTTPLKRLGSAEDVAGALVYLLQADYVTGEVLVVDGGRLIR
ncbi:MAG TPA: SDR family oxidoreductase [Gemmatimonadales bacterium]|nr:SDR family oxidoreductase [Gemmatimonadales bacterium]